MKHLTPEDFYRRRGSKILNLKDMAYLEDNFQKSQRVSRLSQFKKQQQSTSIAAGLSTSNFLDNSRNQNPVSFQGLPQVAATAQAPVLLTLAVPQVLQGHNTSSPQRHKKPATQSLEGSEASSNVERRGLVSGNKMNSADFNQSFPKRKRSNDKSVSFSPSPS